MTLGPGNPMNRALRMLLAFEAVIFGLAIPGMIQVSGVGVSTAVGLGLGGAVLAIAGAGLLPRAAGWAIGWLTQLAGVAFGFATAFPGLHTHRRALEAGCKHTERTFVLIKPDAVRRGLVGQILARFEAKGLAIEALELRHIDAAFADTHYLDHVAKVWYPALRDYIVSGPLVAVVLSGPRAIEAVRVLNGATDGVVAAPGSIRGDF